MSWFETLRLFNKRPDVEKPHIKPVGHRSSDGVMYSQYMVRQGGHIGVISVVSGDDQMRELSVKVRDHFCGAANEW